MTADKQLFYQDANQSDASIAEKVHYASTKGASTFRTNHSVYHVSDLANEQPAEQPNNARLRRQATVTGELQ